MTTYSTTYLSAAKRPPNPTGAFLFTALILVLAAIAVLNVPCFTRLLRQESTSREAPTMVITVTFIDKDRVEEKNTYRQNFVPAEIGHYKAEALAMRYNLSTGCNIAASARPFAMSDYLKRLIENTLGLWKP